MFNEWLVNTAIVIGWKHSYCLTCSCTFSDPRPLSDIDITNPCQFPVALGMEKGYIPDSSIWATSEATSARGAEYARLNVEYDPFKGYSGTV